MKIYWIEKPSYYHKATKRMIKSDNKIPFIVDWNGILIDEVNEYLLFKTENQWNSTGNTSKNNAHQISNFLEYLYVNSIDFKCVVAVEIKKYAAFLSKEGNKETSIGQKLSIIENLYGWLYTKNYIDNDPFQEFGKVEIKNIIKNFSHKKNIDLKLKTKTSHFLSSYQEIEEIPKINDLKNIFKVLSDQDKLMMRLLMETGIRKEELLQLTIGMIKNSKPSKSGKTYNLFLNSNEIQIKYNRSRNVILSSELRTKLLKNLTKTENKRYQKKYKEKNCSTNIEDVPLFLSNRGNRFSTDKLNKTFKQASQKAKVKHLSPHQLRHFYASNFIYKQEEKKSNMEQAYMYLAERLGHASPDTTKAFYVKLMNKEVMKDLAESSLEEFATEFLK